MENLERTKTIESNVLTTEEFDNKVHKLGITTTLIIWCLFILVPLGITIYFKLNINFVKVITITIPIALIFGITGLAEKLSISPIIGPGAMYLASTTGNVQNMKLPAAINAMRIMEVEEGSEKGRVISILAVATSAFVTTAIVFSGMLFLAPIVTPLLTNPVISPAFDNMLPALLGPLVLPAVLKNPKASIIPFGYALIFVFILGSSYVTLQSIVMAVVILLTLGTAKVMFKKKK